jgi:hypothetical protein
VSLVPFTRSSVRSLIRRFRFSHSECNDCGAPNPQWCSLGFGTFICLECSGVHRSMGTHLTVSRALSLAPGSGLWVRLRLSLPLGSSCEAQRWTSGRMTSSGR